MQQKSHRYLAVMLVFTLILSVFVPMATANTHSKDSLPFTDVSESSWAFPYIKDLFKKEVVNGKTATSFAPGDSVTRAEFTAMLSRGLSLTKSSEPYPFSDNDTWAQSEIQAAYEAGIVEGTGLGKFSPNDKITREQMATIAVRAYEHVNSIVELSAEEKKYNDATNISTWAVEAVQKAYVLNIMDGLPSDNFEPKQTALREQSAKVLSVLFWISRSQDHLLGKDNVKKPSEAGALQLVEIDGHMTLAGEDGTPVQLRGMSTHGLQWFPEIINENAFGALSNDWGANVIRLAMYIGENGYATNPAVKDLVYEGIELAFENDMYVIVDWHVHAPGDPRADVYSGAYAFFEEIATHYQDHPKNHYILWELANEPSPNDNGGPGVTNDETGWNAVKEYADPIVDMLREKGDNMILVGTPNWSQRPDLAADNPIDAKNIMYSVHFYAGTHDASHLDYAPGTLSSERGNVMSNVRYALDNGVAVFASEWGTSQANGDGGPYFDKADVWINFLNEHNISWANWSLTNKNEISGAFTPFQLGVTDATNLDPGAGQVWAPEELSLSGEYVRARIKGEEYQPIERTDVEIVIEHAELGTATLPSDFEDGTRQGWDFAGDSPVKVSLTIEEANGSNALSMEYAYPEVKPTDGWATAPRLMLEKEGLTRGSNDFVSFDLYLDPIRASEGRINIHTVFQPPAHGWWQQAAPVAIDLSDLDSATVTADDLYHFEVKVNIRDIDGINDNSELNRLIFVFEDDDSDFAGRVFVDNVLFE